MSLISTKQWLLFAFVIATWLSTLTKAEPRYGFKRKPPGRNRPPPPPDHDGAPPPGRRLRGPPPRKPMDCAASARHFSRMNLMGGWRRVNLSDTTVVSPLTIDLARSSVLEELRHLQKLEGERPLPPPPGPGGRRPPPSFPSLLTLDLASSKINPVEAFTQVVAGINTCTVFNVSECVEKLCKEPVIQCSAKVYTGFLMVRGAPSASVEDVHCTQPVRKPDPRKQPPMYASPASWFRSST